MEGHRRGLVDLSTFRNSFRVRLDGIQHRLEVSGREFFRWRNVHRPDDGLIAELQLHLVPDRLESTRVFAENLRDLTDAVLYGALR